MEARETRTTDRSDRDMLDIASPIPLLRPLLRKLSADADTVLNVGAGAGSYEPTNRHVDSRRTLRRYASAEARFPQ